jgi:hypothetical protein
MASTTGRTSSSVNDPDLQALLDWVPMPLTKVPEGSASKASMPPSFYDKHLSDRVVLKRVKLMGSLVSDIATNVDAILDNIRRKGDILPPYVEVMSAKQLFQSHMSKEMAMANELSVTSLYQVTTASYCRPAASLLALYPHHKTWTSVLVWTMAPANRHFAIADGALQLRLPSDDSGPEVDEQVRQYNRDLWNSLGEEMGPLLRDVGERFPDLAIWEFKSLTVGDDEVMQGIKREALTDILFPWDKCKGPRSCRTKRHAIIDAFAGPDGDDHPWTIPLVEYEGSSNVSGSSAGPGESSTAPRKRKRYDPTFKTAKELTSQKYLQQV